MKSASTLLLRCQHFKCTLQGISQSVHIEFDLSCKFGVLDHCIMGHYLFPAAGYFQLTTELKSMFSDGFPDQLGGDRMMSMGNNKFEEILQKVATLKKDKNEFLMNQFNSWKGSFPQVDDLLIIGLRV